MQCLVLIDTHSRQLSELSSNTNVMSSGITFSSQSHSEDVEEYGYLWLPADYARINPSPDRNLENVQQTQPETSYPVSPREEPQAETSHQSDSKRSGSPKNKEHVRQDSNISQIQLRSRSDTPSPIQQLDSILLSDILSLTPDSSNTVMTQESAIGAAQRQTSEALQSRGFIFPLNRRTSPTSNKVTTAMTQTEMLSTLQNQEPRRRQSPTRKRRDSPSPKRWGSRIPSNRQKSPTLQRYVSPTAVKRVSVTTMTQTSPTQRRKDSGRRHSPIPRRRSSTSPKRWGSKITVNNPSKHMQIPPTTRRPGSPLLRRRISSSPGYENDPVEPQRRGPAKPSYVNVGVPNQGNRRSQTADDSLPATKRTQPSFRRDQNPTPVRIPLPPPLPARPKKKALYENQSFSPRTRETGHNMKNKLHEELKERMQQPRSFKSPKDRRTKKKKEILFIDTYSTAEDVSEWMKNKGFSDLAQETYEDYSGSDIFELSLAEMEEDLGHEEAIRLDGQLKLQKSSVGYATRSAQELTEILRRRREDCELEDDM